jgi:hypothetical protein
MGLDLWHFSPTLPKNGLEDYFTVDELNLNPEFLQRHHQLIVEKDFEEYGKSQVIYVQIKGYQRKGVKSSFYSDFKNDGVYFDLDDVLKAFSYLKADHISKLSDLEENFQSHFIDNFIEGESIFHVSW